MEKPLQHRLLLFTGKKSSINRYFLHGPFARMGCGTRIAKAEIMKTIIEP
jgi:hypothetical protein